MLDHIPSIFTHRHRLAATFPTCFQAAAPSSYPSGSGAGVDFTPFKARQPSSRNRAADDSPDKPESKRHKFRNNSGILPVCAVCLSWRPHPTVTCEAEFTWDGRHSTFAKRVNKLIYVKESNRQICARWQRDTCTAKHAALHVCAGCGADSHGVQHCPCAQKASVVNTL